MSAFLWYYFETKWWQRLAYDPEWSQQVVDAARPILDDLEAYRLEHGAYPEVLPFLLPEVPRYARHSRSRQTSWRYDRISRDEYQV